MHSFGDVLLFDAQLPQVDPPGIGVHRHRVYEDAIEVKQKREARGHM